MKVVLDDLDDKFAVYKIGQKEGQVPPEEAAQLDDLGWISHSHAKEMADNGLVSYGDALQLGDAEAVLMYSEEVRDGDVPSAERDRRAEARRVLVVA